jgi:dTDP-4-amino-4,6-dideoxygalactose transaminase
LGRAALNVPFLDLSRQVESLRGDLDNALGAVLDGGVFVFGEPLEAFEREFAGYCGAAETVGVGSGTEAITIALQALGVGPGDEVVTAANTCVPTIAGIEAAGAVPVLADVDETTFTIAAGSLEAAVTERTRAVVAVHLYGQCADMGAVAAVAQRHGLKVVEDAAQAHGASYEGRRAGTLGDAAAFSFYPTKNLGALGDAGAVVTDDPAAAERARLLRNYGERNRYDSILHGWNSRLDTLQAAALSAKLRRLERWNGRRRELAEAYAEALGDADVVLPVEVSGRHHVYHLYVVRVRDRDAFRETLASYGVGTLIHYPRPVHLQPAYESLARPIGGLEVSERLAREIVSLPLYPELRDAELETVVAAVRRARPG